MTGYGLRLKTGDTFDITRTRRDLEASAYRCVETVQEHGEFAVRGSIMDIYPMGTDHPLRIDLFDDEIESLRIFDAETQLSIDRIPEIDLLPAREFPLSKEAISTFQDNWHLSFTVDARECPLYQDISSGMSPPGVEYYLPLFFDEMASLLDYLPDELLLFCGHIEPAMRQYWDSAASRYENLRHDIHRPILPPDRLLAHPDELFTAMKAYPRIDFETGEVSSFGFSALPNLAVDDRASAPLARLKSSTAQPRRG